MLRLQYKARTVALYCIIPHVVRRKVSVLYRQLIQPQKAAFHRSCNGLAMLEQQLKKFSNDLRLVADKAFFNLIAVNIKLLYI